MNRGNTVFFSTASTGYVEYAATSLLSIRKHAPEANLYILSSGMTDKERILLKNLGISFHEMDLSDLFYQTWQYPIECYYLFAGPEFFFDAGYDFSVYVDGDTLCSSDPFLSTLDGAGGVKATSLKGDYSSIFGDDWSVIRRNWDMSDELKNRPRINAGVVYFNNKDMKDFGFLEKAANLYGECIEIGIPRKGDDSLFSLLQYTFGDALKISYLPIIYNYVLQFTQDRFYPIPNLTFFHFSIDKPWKKQPFSHEDSSIRVYNPLVNEWLLIYKQINYDSYVGLVGSRCQKTVINLRSQVGRINRKLKHLAIDAIYWLEGRKYSLPRRMRNIRKRTLSLYWWQDYSSGIHNFGDEITKDIMLNIFGYRSVLATVDDAEVAGVGSILEVLGERTSNKPIHIWGSGFIMPRNNERPYNDSSFSWHAVRGKITLSRAGLNQDRVSLGDPGLLASIVYPRASYTSDKIGVVVHYIEKDLPIVKKMRLDSRLMIIDPLDTPGVVAKKISSCKLILSSSLHGLIFADSYGIPNIHIQLSNRPAGGDYKFKDYYSATNRKYRVVDDKVVFDDDRLSDLIKSYSKVEGLRAIQRRLVKVFPYS